MEEPTGLKMEIVLWNRARLELISVFVIFFMLFILAFDLYLKANNLGLFKIICAGFIVVGTYVTLFRFNILKDAYGKNLGIGIIKPSIIEIFGFGFIGFGTIFGAIL